MAEGEQQEWLFVAFLRATFTGQSQTTLSSGSIKLALLPAVLVEKLRERKVKSGLSVPDVATVAEIQRVLDTEPGLVAIIGESDADRVVSKFSKQDAVAEMQSDLQRKVERIEKRGLELNVVQVPAVKRMSEELNMTLFTLHHEWGAGVAAIHELAKGLQDGVGALRKAADESNGLNKQVIGRLNARIRDRSSRGSTRRGL